MIGETLGHYRILERLGSGGMGEVFLAEDLKLKRRVALKVLPAELAADPERMARLQREAESQAALNHPSVVTLHSIEEAGGRRFLTMEHVEGETLERHLPRGGLPLDRFFAIAVPLADAVAAAHDRGITHRDLKPGNVMVASDGRVKVLDFGLAKPGGEAPDGDGRTLTEEGTIVGTVPYMSPEQVQGRAADERSDIFSLGVVFYEMLTGARPFRGDSSAAIASAILRDAPAPVQELKPDLPRHLGRIVRRCLEKDPLRRYQAARDLKIELEDLEHEEGAPSAETSAAAPADAPRRRRRGLWLAAALAVAALAAAVYLARFTAEPPAPAAPGRLVRLTSDPGLEYEPALSPDGRFVAYTSDERGNLDILLLPLAGGSPLDAVRHPADDAQAAWSPDGGQLAFVSARDRGGHLSAGVNFGPMTPYLQASGGDLFVAAAFGGEARKLFEGAYYPSWSPDGSEIAFQSSHEGGWDILAVPAGGGAPRRVSHDPALDYQPAWSPDGRWIAYGSYDGGGKTLLRVVGAADGALAASFDLGERWLLRPAWAVDGGAVFASLARGGNVDVVRFPFDPGSGLGEPAAVTTGAGSSIEPTVAAGPGDLVFASVDMNTDVWALELESGDLRRLTSETAAEDYPDLSPDGTRLLAVSDRGGPTALWIFDLGGGRPIEIGPVASFAFGGRWSADGRQVVYTREEGEQLVLALHTLGSMTERRLVEGNAFGADWSPDGRQIAYVAAGRAELVPSIYVQSLDDGAARVITPPETSATFPSWSPDGRRIVYSANQQDGGRLLEIVSVDGGEPRRLEAESVEASHPRFSPVDGNLIAFLRDHKVLCLLDLASGEIRELTSFRDANLTLDYPAWSRDGRSIVFAKTPKTGDLYRLVH